MFGWHPEVGKLTQNGSSLSVVNAMCVLSIVLFFFIICSLACSHSRFNFHLSFIKRILPNASASVLAVYVDVVACLFFVCAGKVSSLFVRSFHRSPLPVPLCSSFSPELSCLGGERLSAPVSQIARATSRNGCRTLFSRKKRNNYLALLPPLFALEHPFTDKGQSCFGRQR